MNKSDRNIRRIESHQIAWPIIVVLVCIGLGWVLKSCAPETTREFNREDYFITNQVVLTGPNRDAILNVEQTSGGEIVIVEESIINIDLDALQDDFGYCSGLPSELSNFVIALAEIDDESTTVEQVIADFNVDGVTVEPNLITGSPDYPVGSTVGWESVAVKSQADYASQWAFEAIDLEPAKSSNDTVRIVVFDTVPNFIEIPQATAETDVGSTLMRPGNYTVDWVDTNNPMTLTVGEAWKYAQIAAIEDADEALDLSHHGLFAAQMAHAVAPPNSNIELIRVLDGQVHGNLYSLITSFYSRILDSEELGDLYDLPTVVNMSLGIRIPPPQAEFQLPTLGLEALHTVIQLAYCRNVVIVAASGNNSIKNYPPELAHLPADWSSVIAVAASNSENQRSCFSNQGEIAAPGGDGRLPGDSIPRFPLPLGCRARLMECPDQGGSCPFAVIGPIAPPPTPTDLEGEETNDKESNETGLIFWEGSSFASPLVAGLAARILAQSPDLSPDDVRHIIECGATKAEFPHDVQGRPDRHIGEGVINVRHTFEECMPPPIPSTLSSVDQ